MKEAVSMMVHTDLSVIVEELWVGMTRVYGKGIEGELRPNASGDVEVDGEDQPENCEFRW